MDEFSHSLTRSGPLLRSTSGILKTRVAKRTVSLDDCVKQVQTIVDTCKSLRSEILVLCHGGPIATPKEAQHLLDYCRGLDSFYGASSLERLPTEHAIVAETKLFTALRLGKDNAQ